MKTNVKIPRTYPAIAFFAADNFSLSYHYKGEELTVQSSTQLTGFKNSIEDRISVVLKQIDCSSGKLIIILSSEFTLYSEQIFPAGLSDTQIGELLILQLSKRTDSGEINTFYDYFLLKKTQASSTYGLIEARKDVVCTWMDIFKNYGFNSVALLPQPIVLINYILKNSDINVEKFKIVCLLSTRMIAASIQDNHVQKISETVIQVDPGSANSVANQITHQLDEESCGSKVPVIILDTIESGICDGLADNFRIFPGFHKEHVLGENTIKWLRADYDLYKSIALA